MTNSERLIKHYSELKAQHEQADEKTRGKIGSQMSRIEALWKQENKGESIANFLLKQTPNKNTRSKNGAARKKRGRKPTK